MSTKFEQAPAVEPHRAQATVMANASAASTSSPKVSMFAAKAKAGFVIPKNKLSGSLVPIFRGGKKTGGSDVVNEENAKLVQRKTKWGPDLTQDSAVRKGRALAYQTRVDQITKQLNSGILEMGDNVDSTLEAQAPDGASVHQISSENSEVLELERREAIGEVIKLNPSYKAPPDYKPLLKEAKVPVPIKEHTGYNFIGLIFGSANDTQKRLEKETGAKVRVYGTKEDTGEKGEITSNDVNEVHGGYKELYVQISADTYEKVDAAVALIELLVTPVSVNPSAVSTTSTSVSGDNTHVVDQSQGTSSPYAIPATGVNQGTIYPVMGSGQPPAQGQFQPYPGQWFPAGPPQTPAQPPTGFIPASNPSAPILSNPVQASSSPFNPSNMPSLFGPRPVLPVGLPSVSQNPSLVQSRPQPPVLQRPFMPQPPFGARNPLMPTLQPSPQPNISAPPPITGNQPPPMGPPPMVRPSGPLLSQPMPITASGSLSDRQLAPPSIGPASMVHLQSSVVPHMGPHPVTSQSIVSPVNYQSRPSVPEPSGASGNHSIAPSAFASVLQPQAGPPSAPMSAPRPIQSSSIAPIQQMPQSVMPNPSLPPPSSVGILTSVQGSAPSFTPIKPPLLTAPKPHPNSSDFTFQPHLPQNLASQAAPRPGMPPLVQNMRAPNPTEQSIPLATLTPSFQPPIHSLPQPVMQGNTRPQFNNQMNQTQGQIPPVPANAALNAAPFGRPPFPNPNPQMGPMNLNPAPLVPNKGGGAFPPRPGNPPQFQQNYPGWRQSPLAPNQQPGNKLPFASHRPVSSPGTPQIYDPFSPTSVSAGPLQGGNPAKMRKQESDPEYEDLMASVGVK